MNRCAGSLIAGLLAFSPGAQGQQLEHRETVGFQNASQWNSRFSVIDYNTESGDRVFDNGRVAAGDGFTISAVTDPRGNIRLHVHSVSEDNQQSGDQDFGGPPAPSSYPVGPDHRC
jgi:hypothetical protein